MKKFGNYEIIKFPLSPQLQSKQKFSSFGIMWCVSERSAAEESHVSDDDE